VVEERNTAATELEGDPSAARGKKVGLRDHEQGEKKILGSFDDR